jgi:hypothetical protein
MSGGAKGNGGGLRRQWQGVDGEEAFGCSTAV